MLSHRSVILTAAAAGAVAVASAHAEAPATGPAMQLTSTGDQLVDLVTPQPPDPKRAYAPLRFDEDWRWLKNGSKDPDLFDPAKYIPLGSSDLSATFGGSARVRYEWKINPTFGATNAANPTPNTDYFLERAYLHADLRYKSYARIFVEGVGAWIDNGTRTTVPSPNPSDHADLHQAFLDLSPLNLKTDGFGLTFRFGRQELLFDKQKLVGPLDWANVRRSWDGGDFLLSWEQWKAQLFWVRPVQVIDKEFDPTDEQTNFAGAYLTHPFFLKDSNFSVFSYYLNRDRDARTTFAAGIPEFNADGTRGNTDRVTLGGRIWGKFLKDWDYDVEGGYQTGQYAGNDIIAGYFSGELGYTFSEIWGKPRLSVGYDYASGDDRRGDGTSNTFDQLFPTGHMYFGYLDLVGRQNINAGNITASINPTPELRLWATWNTFCLASGNDALYNAGGQTVRYSAAGNAGSYVGDEVDLTMTYQIGRHTTFLAGYGIFFPGDFINNTGKSETAQMVYTSLEFKF